MARLVSKDGKQKVVMLVSGSVFKLYRENVQLAKSLGYRLECHEDFEKWFRTEQKKVRQELERMASGLRTETR